jgi:hypothetical protein
MKNFALKIFLFLAVTFLCYCLLAFCNLETDPRQWNTFSQFVQGALMFVCLMGLRE